MAYFYRPRRFVRLCDNALKKKKKEEKKKKEKTRKWRWRTPEEQQEVKDGREKEFIEAYVNTLKDRGETEEKKEIILK